RPSRGDESSSESSQRRSYSSTGVEEKPSTSSIQSSRFTESISTSTVPKTSSDTESDTKKRSRSFVRPPLRSAVPDSQLISLARRPAQSGRVGQRVEVYTNHFKIEFLNINEGVTLYQFDVDVEILMRDGSWRSSKKDERFQVMKKNY
ncbi:unnamed protein product, partial [Rotaria sp. Silwood2]